MFFHGFPMMFMCFSRVYPTFILRFSYVFPTFFLRFPGDFPGKLPQLQRHSFGGRGAGPGNHRHGDDGGEPLGIQHQELFGIVIIVYIYNGYLIDIYWIVNGYLMDIYLSLMDIYLFLMDI